MNNAANLIKASIRQNSIVHSTDPDVMPELQAECEDSVANGAVVEYWGTNESGDEWRVHVTVN